MYVLGGLFVTSENCVFSLHSRKWFGRKGRGGVSKPVSRKSNTISEEQIEQLKTEQMKK